MAGDLRRIADPHARPNLLVEHWQPIFLPETGKMIVGGKRTHVERRRSGHLGAGADPLKRFRYTKILTGEVEAIKIVAVEIASSNFGIADESLRRNPVVELG